MEQFWTETNGVGRLFQPAIGLEDEAAWDVYLVYPSGVSWGKAQGSQPSPPPAPSYFMHQLGDRLPDHRRLDAETLAERLKLLLGAP